MKKCPSCETTYTDDTLKYCLADGNPLADTVDEVPTVVRTASRDTVVLDPAANSKIALKKDPSRSSSAKWIVFTVVGVLLVFAAIAAFGIAGAAFFFSGAADTAPEPVRTPTPRPSPTAVVDKEKERLRDELANIQKQLEKQKKNTPAGNSDNDDERGSPITATVNSPKDGFLALRSVPDAERGERVAKIPHGVEVELLNCEKASVTIAGRTGRWCQVDYAGMNGWVFDAWLNY